MSKLREKFLKRIRLLKNTLRGRMGKNVIRKKLLLYFLITAVMVNVLTLFTYNNTHILTDKLNAMFINDITLTNLSKNVARVETSLKGYLMTSHSEDLQNYLNYADTLRNSSQGLITQLSDNESELLLVDIKNMINTYLDDTDAAVKFKRGTDIDDYNDKFNDASTVYDYINTYIDKLKIYQFQENNENYLQLDSKLGALQFFSILVILATIIGNIILIFLFAFSITEPIIRLSKAANTIAEGNYDVSEVKVNTNDELKTLAEAFNRMAESIRRQIVEIKAKARIETQLKEQEMQNLKMKSTLDEAQLGSLQAQIDPHYMFNTLNAGMQLAMFEGAQHTQDFMENLSLTMRYSLGNIKKPATLSQEIDNIDQYVYLLKVRFGEKFSYEKSVPEALPHLAMPRMILQPIVENAFTHGIGEMQGGKILLSVAQSDNCMNVSVCDNGADMTPEMLQSLLGEDYRNTPVVLEESKVGHYSIGLRNVIGRLMLFYHAASPDKIMKIVSAPGKGTTVTLKLPLDSADGLEEKPAH